MLEVLDVLPIVLDVPDVCSFLLPLDDVEHVRKVHLDVTMCFAPDCIMSAQPRGASDLKF